MCLRIDVSFTRGLHLEHESELLVGVTPLSLLPLSSCHTWNLFTGSACRMTTAAPLLMYNGSQDYHLEAPQIDLLSSADSDAVCSAWWTLFGTSTARHFVSRWNRTLVSFVTVEDATHWGHTHPLFNPVLQYSPLFNFTYSISQGISGTSS